MEMVTLRLNDREVTAQKGQYLLKVARDNGFEVPTMCQNEALKEGGHCRLCLVELREGDWSKLVTSCLYPAKAGLNVYLDSPKVRAARKTVLELMLARAPKAEAVQHLARKYLGKVATPYSTTDPDERCVLCGQCVAACEEVVGVSAIGVASRGVYKRVTTPFEAPSNPCIGCGACAFVCPTDAIPMSQDGAVRRIWGRDFALHRCTKCGEAYIPVDQIEWLVSTAKVKREFFDRCQNCR